MFRVHDDDATMNAAGEAGTAGRTSETELYIQFDGRQLEVRTNSPEMRELFERNYGPMLASRAEVSAGHLEIMKTDDGYSIRGMENIEVRGQTVASLTDYLKREVLFQFVKARPDLLWIHAGAAERDGSSLVIVGPSGHGKSTLVTLLCERGWRFMSDDAAPVRMEADEVIPFPLAPLRRIYPGRELRADEMGSFAKEEVPISRAKLRLEPAPIRAVVFPMFRQGGSPEFLLRSPGESSLDLLRNCTNFADHKEAAVARAVALARSIPMYHLSYGDGRSAAAALDSMD
jgi:hypothetical protein